MTGPSLCIPTVNNMIMNGVQLENQIVGLCSDASIHKAEGQVERASIETGKLIRSMVE
jgi:hypothetical protein